MFQSPKMHLLQKSILSLRCATWVVLALVVLMATIIITAWETADVKFARKILPHFSVDDRSLGETFTKCRRFVGGRQYLDGGGYGGDIWWKQCDGGYA